MATPKSEKRTSAISPWKRPQSYTFDDPTPHYEPHPPLLSNPPPSYDSDSDTNHTPSFATALRLRSSIATAPEYRLREIMTRLIDRNPSFQHAIAKELLAPAAPPASRSPRRKHRRPRRSSDTAVPDRKCSKCNHRIGRGDGTQARDSTCVFHPGHLRDDVYEFLSRTPEGRTFEVVRKIAMWSCCDQDVWSPGCVAAGSHVLESDHPPQVRSSEIP